MPLYQVYVEIMAVLTHLQRNEELPAPSSGKAEYMIFTRDLTQLEHGDAQPQNFKRIDAFSTNPRHPSGYKHVHSKERGSFRFDVSQSVMKQGCAKKMKCHTVFQLPYMISKCS